jgi:peroxiredoxin
MPPTEGETVPDFEAVCCDGETFRSRTLSTTLGERGGLLVSTGFAFSAIAQNWYKRFERYGWTDREGVPLLGVSRDGPYAANEFLRQLGVSARLFADVNGGVAEALGLLTDREHMANVATPRRSVFVLRPDRTVAYAHVADDWISPLPREDVTEALDDL